MRSGVQYARSAFSRSALDFPTDPGTSIRAGPTDTAPPSSAPAGAAAPASEAATVSDAGRAPHRPFRPCRFLAREDSPCMNCSHQSRS